MGFGVLLLFIVILNGVKDLAFHRGGPELRAAVPEGEILRVAQNDKSRILSWNVGRFRWGWRAQHAAARQQDESAH